jgi:hypothetical protein
MLISGCSAAGRSGGGARSPSAVGQVGGTTRASGRAPPIDYAAADEIAIDVGDQRTPASPPINNPRVRRITPTCMAIELRERLFGRLELGGRIVAPLECSESRRDARSHRRAPRIALALELSATLTGELHERRASRRLLLGRTDRRDPFEPVKQDALVLDAQHHRRLHRIPLRGESLERTHRIASIHVGERLVARGLLMLEEPPARRPPDDRAVDARDRTVGIAAQQAAHRRTAVQRGERVEIVARGRV